MIDWSLFSIEDYERLVLAFVKQHYTEFRQAANAVIVSVESEDVVFKVNTSEDRLVIRKTSLEYLIPGLVAERLEDFAHLDKSKRAVVKQMEDLVKSLENHLQLWSVSGSGGTCAHGVGAALNNTKKNLEFFRKLYCN